MPCQHPVTWQRKYADLVNDEIEVILASLSDVPDFCDLVKEPLAGVGHGIDVGIRYKSWYLLPLVVCEAISGYYERAVPASAALRFFMAAGEVFDDIEDADAPGSLSAKYGPAVATNAATALLILAERAISRLKERSVTDCVIVRIMDAINSFYTTACAGQHLDLSFTSDTSISEDIYLKIASMKSATTIECACYIGALFATTSQELVDSFTLFGHNLGMASQIANDIQGIIRGNDIIEHKITLPIVYALAHTEGEAHNRLELAFSKPYECVPSPTQTKDLLFRSGAIHYTAIKMELYKQNALDILHEFVNAGTNVEKLRLFLE